MEYHFGVSKMAVWTSHILIGLFLTYVGYIGVLKEKISKHFSIILIILGVLAALYHSHIWFVHIK